MDASEPFQALAISLSAASPAFAQDANSEAEERSKDGGNFVTARIRERYVLDTPLATTVVAGETLEARGRNNIGDDAERPILVE